MSPSLKRVLAILLLVLMLVVAGVIAAAWALLPLDSTVVTIDGERFAFGELSGTASVVFVVIAVAVVVFALVAAITAGVFGLGLGVLGLAFGGLVTLATLAFVAAPIVLVGWLIWRAARTRPAPVAMRS